MTPTIAFRLALAKLITHRTQMRLEGKSTFQQSPRGEWR